jgi:hypothetical protein
MVFTMRRFPRLQNFAMCGFVEGKGCGIFRISESIGLLNVAGYQLKLEY